MILLHFFECLSSYMYNLQIIVIIVARLNRVGALYKKDAKSLSKFAILRAREAFRQNPPHNMQVCKRKSELATFLFLYF